MKSSHAYSKPTMTSVPPGLLSTIIFSYFIFQVDEKFPMAVVVLYLFSVHLFFSNHILMLLVFYRIMQRSGLLPFKYQGYT